MKIEGLKDMEAALVALGKKAGGRAMRRALNNSTAPIKRAAKRNVNSQRVKRSIKSKVFLGKGVKTSVASVQVGVLGPHAYLGNFIEGGTRKHSLAAGSKLDRGHVGPKGTTEKKRLSIGDGVYSNAVHKGTSAKPFMRPAWDNNHQAAVKILGIRLRERIVLEALREGRR